MVRKSWLENGPGSSNDLRGSNPFVHVSWDEAEKLVADELPACAPVLATMPFMAGLMGDLARAGSTMPKAN